MNPPFRQWPASLRMLVLVSFAIGLIERVGWALLRKNGSATGEAFNVAVAIAKGHGFADAFFENQGPTAHFLPIPPTIAGGVYALFGVQSSASEWILLALSLALVFGSYWLFAGVFLRLGASVTSGAYGFAFLCVAPIYTTPESFDFRIWEGGFTMLTAGIYLRLLLAENLSPLKSWVRAALPALVFFLNPMIGIASLAAFLLFLWLQGSGRRLRDITTLMAAFFLLLAPWTARNLAVMGHPIWLRDNLGLELALANHPAAVSPEDPDAVFQARLLEIHPFLDGPGRQALKVAGGEYAYAQWLGRQTRTWMAAHPGDVATIWSGHLRQLILPHPWEFATAHGRTLPVVRAYLVDLVNILGAIGLIMLWRRDRLRTAYLLPFVIFPILAYIPFQPITRYLWLIYIPLTYPAAVAATGLWQRATGRRAIRR